MGLSMVTLLALLIISWDLANAYMQSYYAQAIPAIAFVIGYCLAPRVQRFFAARRDPNAPPPMKYWTRIAWALAITVAASAVALAVLALFSAEIAYTFLSDNYFAGVFVLAFFFAPTVARYWKSLRRGSQAI